MLPHLTSSDSNSRSYGNAPDSVRQIPSSHNDDFVSLMKSADEAQLKYAEEKARSGMPLTIDEILRIQKAKKVEAEAIIAKMRERAVMVNTLSETQISSATDLQTLKVVESRIDGIAWVPKSHIIVVTGDTDSMGVSMFGVDLCFRDTGTASVRLIGAIAPVSGPTDDRYLTVEDVTEIDGLDTYDEYKYFTTLQAIREEAGDRYRTYVDGSTWRRRNPNWPGLV